MTGSRDKIFIHHVGGRGGSFDFPLSDKFNDDLCIYLYDMDENCIDHARSRSSSINLAVVKACLSKENSIKPIFLNYDPNTSSMYSFNNEYETMYYPYPNSNFDYTFSSAYRLVERVEVPVFSMDNLVKKDGLPYPDYLSIDAQGSEMNILMGATEVLNTVLGVTCEVSFKQIYENQPLFAEVDDFLRGHGYVLIELNGFPPLFSEKVNRSVRCNGQLYGGEVLYLKKTEFLRDSHSLYKLAFIAYINGQFDLMQECFMHHLWQGKYNQSSYVKMVNELYSVWKEMPVTKSRKFEDKWSVKSSRERYSVQESTEGTSGKINSLRKIFRKSAIIVLVWRPIRFLKNISSQIKRLIMSSAVVEIAWVSGVGASPIEKVIRRHGMKDIFKQVFLNRLDDKRRIL